mmetsp:Transcript_32899/g.79978  ORF Transcript_32899/g.79978 Transcript_32899/m.79978 type:complete len:392 (-) Transcript_32899:59-1234(-)
MVTCFSSRLFRTSGSSSWTFLVILLLVVILQCSIVVVQAGEDFYKLLGVGRDASKKEIKKAYRQKSLEYHPDKNKEEGAAEKFAEINRAYEVLSDEELKQVYDRHGEEGLKQHEQRGAGGGGGGFDPFEQFFGFGNRQREPREQTTPNVDLPLELTLEQIYAGASFEVEYIRQVLCLKWEMCMKTAQECSGPGVRVKRQQIAPGFVQQVQQHDERCIARGKMWIQNCSDCPRKTETEKIELTVDVQKGIRPGEVINFEGVADEKPGYKAGDLNFVVMEKDHPTYHRDGDHLYMTMDIPLVDALTGFSLTLKQLDGTEFDISNDDIIECDEVLRVPGKGMPRRSGRGYGDLFIKFEVDFPDALSQSQKEKLREVLGEKPTSSTDSSNENSEL